MRVRPARPGDAEALRAAVSRAREATVFDDIGAPLLDVSAAGVREAASAADCCYLVEEDHTPVGLAIAHPDADGAEAELLALWVHPEYTGGDIENRLLTRVASSLSERGVSRIRATVDRDQPSAREFYRAHGFSHRENHTGRGGAEQVVVAAVESFL
ncbi:N-acetyltransferase family protein [Halorubrum sp. DTA98]|uniref:GNAT family N-acetyltransferase n=1 Tax=Halorubrum sp. DTA98 TaxID=3402163 RepID=UPI003AABBA89